MAEIRQYILSVISAALVSGILSGFVKKGAPGEFLRMLCSLFLVLTIMQPFSKADFSALASFTIPYKEEGKSVAVSGIRMADKAREQIIKQNLEAYILDKAAQHYVDICVEVTLNDDLIPISAELSGKMSPSARQHLEQILTSDLGIAKENQLWTG